MAQIWLGYAYVYQHGCIGRLLTPIEIKIVMRTYPFSQSEMVTSGSDEVASITSYY